MPQPVSRVKSDANIEIGNVGTRTLASRPALAVMAMEAIAAWAHVESFMLRMYVELAGGAQSDAAAAYLALDTTSAKSKVVSVLAKLKLSKENYSLLRALIKLTKTAQKDRDKLAHWIWGSSEQLPDAILLADPRNLDLSTDQIFVFREADFESMRVKFERIAGMGLKFRFILLNHPANRDGRLYKEICEEPEIAEILGRNEPEE